jgi:hypothetical protein
MTMDLEDLQRGEQPIQICSFWAKIVRSAMIPAGREQQTQPMFKSRPLGNWKLGQPVLIMALFTLLLNLS